MTTQPVNADVVGFQTDGVLNPADPNNGTTGAVSGMLPAEVTISNTASTNEYTEALTFGTTIDFNLTLSGPGVNLAGQAGGSSGSTFVLDFFDQNGNPFLSTPRRTILTPSQRVWCKSVRKDWSPQAPIQDLTIRHRLSPSPPRRSLPALAPQVLLSSC